MYDISEKDDPVLITYNYLTTQQNITIFDASEFSNLGRMCCPRR
jgi:hypothetical protein